MKMALLVLERSTNLKNTELTTLIRGGVSSSDAALLSLFDCPHKLSFSRTRPVAPAHGTHKQRPRENQHKVQQRQGQQLAGEIMPSTERVWDQEFRTSSHCS